MKGNLRLLDLLARLLVFLFIGVGGRPLLAQTWMADNGNGTYTNPLFFDEFADPDIIRVGADFYLTGSSMHMNPGLPILHSRDLVNWDFQSYASPSLDLGPEYRLEGEKNVYGQGIWAPSFRFHNGTFYIFANVNGQTTQMFRATSPLGPWTRTPMKRSLHDLSVLFDDDGKVYVVWNYGDVRIAELDASLTDIVPGTERPLLSHEAGLGEGHHFYKIKSRYYLVDAWYNGIMRMPVARADSLAGPWEVNRDISVGEQFGQVLGWRLSSFRPPLSTLPPYTILPPDPSAKGRMAIHQGGLVDTPNGEWWGLSMGEENAVGRVVTLSPITWTDGWPYFGLPGNLGRSPRTWVKPNLLPVESPHAPYRRSDDFARPELQPVWQWNHVPVETAWSLTERPGYLRLHALAAHSIWDARNSLTQRAAGPHSIATALMETQGMNEGELAGLALLIQPDASIAIERTASGTDLVQHDGQTMKDQRVPTTAKRVWLRADCDYLTQLAQFSYSLDGEAFHDVGPPFRMVTIGVTFQGVRYTLFNFQRGPRQAGYADFDSFRLVEPEARARQGTIPFGQRVALSTKLGSDDLHLAALHGGLVASSTNATRFRILDLQQGRVALQAPGGFLSAAPDGNVSIVRKKPGRPEAFQWIKTFTGELTLLSLETNRYLEAKARGGAVLADSAGPEPDGPPGVRFRWHPSKRDAKAREHLRSRERSCMSIKPE